MTDGVLYVQPILDHVITELLESLKCNLALDRMDQNIMFQWSSVGFRSEEGRSQSMASTPSSFRNCLHIFRHCCAPGGSQDPLHQRWVWQWLQRFHPGALEQSECCCLACSSVSLHGYASPYHAEGYYRQHKVLHISSRPFHAHFPHVLRASLLSSMKSTGCQRWACQFWCSMATASWAPQCRSVSRGPTRGYQALRPPSWSLIPIVWSETFTPVACWR